MRAVVQRVSRAKVTVAGEVTGEIGRGLVVLLGVSTSDVEADANYLADKILNLRIFEDTEGRMNHSLIDINAGLLVVSQFTLYADTSRGRRPSFIMAANSEDALGLYEYFVSKCCEAVKVETGKFGAMMDVELVNDGPVTIILDSVKSN